MNSDHQSASRYAKAEKKHSIPSMFQIGLLGMALLLTAVFVDPSADAATFYLSPTGSNSNTGTSSQSPWKTFAFAIPKLQPGDTLILNIGTYNGNNSGYPNIVCGTNAKSGTAGQPITIKAASERRAFLQGDGSARPVYIRDCSNWIVEGLRAESGDFLSESGDERGSVFAVQNSSNITLKRNLGQKPNRYMNAHVFVIFKGSNVLLEENEAYSFHRHGFSYFRSSFITSRRNYSNARWYPKLPGYLEGSPQEGMTFYWTNDSIMENDINERSQYIANNGSRNKILGSISLNSSVGFATGHHASSGLEAVDNDYADNLATANSSVGFITQSETSARFNNNSAIGNGKGGFIANNKYSSQNDPSKAWTISPNLTVKNTLSFNNGTGGYLIEHATQFSGRALHHLNALINPSGNYRQGTETRTNSIEVDPQLGSCLVYVPEGSKMKSAGENGHDIGANILNRYENGVLTSKVLWNPVTGAFPCGAVIPGVNDIAGVSCLDVHVRLNVNTNGCFLPSGYGQTAILPAPGKLTISQ